MSKRTYLLILFLWLTTAVSPVFAGQKADTTYTFRFVPQKDMFYVPWNGNDMELRNVSSPSPTPKAMLPTVI